MTANSITFDATVLPDCYVGVPYFVGVPYHGASSASGITVASVLTGALPPGLIVKQSNDPVVTGTVLPAGITGTQVDGSYSFTLVLGDSNGTQSGAFTMNVHYLTDDQDLSVAEQAELRQTPFLNTSATDQSDFTQTTVATDAG
jgi:hypothetical protein